MKTKAIALFLLGFIPAFAQDIPTSKTEQNMDRIERCKKNYTELFGGEALTGQGTDPEMMDILQKFIFGEVFRTGDLDKKTRELLAYCILTTLEAESQLHSHLEGNLLAGNSKETLTAAVIQCLPYIGFPSAIKALKIIKESSQPAPKKNLVRLSKITVDPAQLERYNAFLEEEIEASMRLEPGVLTLYAVSEKEHPNKVTILEIYADQDAYKSHIQTPHFQKYKQGTLQMVQELELVDSTPLIPGLKIK